MKIKFHVKKKQSLLKQVTTHVKDQQRVFLSVSDHGPSRIITGLRNGRGATLIKQSVPVDDTVQKGTRIDPHNLPVNYIHSIEDIHYSKEDIAEGYQSCHSSCSYKYLAEHESSESGQETSEQPCDDSMKDIDKGYQSYHSSCS